MLRLIAALVTLAICAWPARAEEEFCSLPFSEQVHHHKVQEFLIVSGLLNSEIGNSIDIELQQAMRWLRSGTTTPPNAALTAEECHLVEERLATFHKFARLVPKRLEYNELYMLLPEALGSEVARSEKFDKLQREQSWVDFDQPDWSFGFDVFKTSLYRDTPSTLQSGSLMHWKNVSLFYLQNSFEEAVAEGVGDFTHLITPRVTQRYFFHNLAFEYRGAVRGIFLKFSVKEPHWFEVPEFLRGALSSSERTQLIRRDFHVVEDRQVAWLLFVQAVSNIVVSHFKLNNGWKRLSLKRRPERGGCGLAAELSDASARAVRVIFGTTRKPSAPLNDLLSHDASAAQVTPSANELFTSEADDLLHIGCAQLAVSGVPSTDGEVVRADRSSEQVSLSSVGLVGSIEPADQGYVRLVDDHTTAKQERALLFIHGYNTSFAWSLQRAAELATSTRYNGQVYMFSWASRESVFEYLADLERAKAAQGALLGFLRAILQDRNVRILDIVAHSAGCEQILGTLERMLPTFDKRAPDPSKLDSPDSKRLRLGQIVLAAPDVDSHVFREKVAALAPFAERVTVYVSEADLPLRLSRFFRSGQQRAGHFRSGEAPVKIKARSRDARSHVIDVTGTLDRFEWTGGMCPRIRLGHDDFIAAPEVNADIRRVLAAAVPKSAPDRRGRTPKGNIFCAVPYEHGQRDVYWVMRRMPVGNDNLSACPQVESAKAATR